MRKPRAIYRGSVEYIEATVTSETTLASQPVAMSFDRQTWHPAAWTGEPGTTRTARLLVDNTILPARSNTSVYVRVTEGTETPIMHAGFLHLA